MRHGLPPVSIPLAQGDADTEIELQRSFDAVYERGAYGQMLDYQEPWMLPVRAADTAWIATRLQTR